MVLAAGTSTRFLGDQPKQLVSFGAEALVRRVAAQVLRSRVSDVVVVTGFAGPAVAAAVADLDVRVVANPDFRRGQSTSVKAGLAAVAGEAEAVVFVPSDQPFVDAALVDLLVDTWSGRKGAIVLPSFAGRRGAPVLFDRSFFGELERIRGDRGGRQILRLHSDRVLEVELLDETPLLDFDTVSELEDLLSLLAEQESS